jgi:hypothetical protein
VSAVHGVDLVGRDREDHTNLITAAVPLVRTTGVPLGEELDVLCPPFGGGIRDTPSDGEIAGRLGGITNGDGHTGVSLDVAHLLMGLNRVDDHVITVCVDPGLGRLRRAVGHQRGDEARVRAPKQLDEAVGKYHVGKASAARKSLRQCSFAGEPSARCIFLASSSNNG